MADLDDMHCSFCAKPRQECSRLIAGPASVFICDECVGLCASILVDGAPGLSPLASIAGSVKRLHDVDRLTAEIDRLSRTKALRADAANALIAARKAIDDAAEAFEMGMIAKCYWCGVINRDDAIKDHAAECDKHPAVMKLREATSRKRKAVPRG